MKRLNLNELETDICPITGKIQYKTVEDASNPRIFTGKINNKEYNIYKCKYCKFYHIGHWHRNMNYEKVSKITMSKLSYKDPLVKSENGYYRPINID